MSEPNIITACPSPLLSVQAWKIPDLDTTKNYAIPGWVMSAIVGAARDPHFSGYGNLVGMYVVRDAGVTRIMHVSDFRRQYVEYHIDPATGEARASEIHTRGRCQGKDYLIHLASYLNHLGNLWEGPDGCPTYETETLSKLSAQLCDFANRSEAAQKQNILPFLYQPPDQKVQE